MFGWEFPPYNSGGLGTACYGLTRSLSALGADVTFVLPHLPDDLQSSHVRLVSASSLRNVRFREVNSPIVGYMTSDTYHQRIAELVKGKGQSVSLYGRNLYEEVARYADNAGYIAREEEFDIIHCHDWMTYGAGIHAKKISGKPLVVHIHATEFDRTGGNPNQYVYDIEKAGFQCADKIFAVSNFTKQKVVEHYGIPSEKVVVVHNAVEFTDIPKDEYFAIKDDEKVVLFLGRITLQKGPDYFVYAARAVADHYPKVKFIVVGNGDMEKFMIEKAVELGLSDKMLFAGFLRGKDIDRAYKMADVYVMPSVSEPFGITPLEAMRNGVPVIISKQSGVSEVINHCLKVDFWDIERMADMIISVLKHDELHTAMRHHGLQELKKFSWDNPAKKCIEVYQQLISRPQMGVA
jgi:glycogen synthase